MPSREVDNVEKRSKIPKMIDLSSTDIRISPKLDNKPKRKYHLFAKFSLEVFGACGVAKKSHMFLTRANQHIQYINIHFCGTLNIFGTVALAINQEKN